MGEWTSLHEILQDLSEAQGCMVPASLEIYDDRPPVLSIPEEESEEQSYLESGGGGDVAGPDYELIQQMLNMVKGKKDSKEDDQPASDLCPLSPEFVPQKVQKKVNRNVAISSIITAQKQQIESRRPIPKDVIPTMFKRKNSPKVNSDCSSPSQMSSPEKLDQYVPTGAANDYYSKYLKHNKLKEQFDEDIWLRAEHEINEIEERRQRQADIGSPQKFDNHQYIPSSRANEYYSKYLQKNRLKEHFEEDIWSRAERQMKEIDAKNLFHGFLTDLPAGRVLKTLMHPKKRRLLPPKLPGGSYVDSECFCRQADPQPGTSAAEPSWIGDAAESIGVPSPPNNISTLRGERRPARSLVDKEIQDLINHGSKEDSESDDEEDRPLVVVPKAARASFQGVFDDEEDDLPTTPGQNQWPLTSWLPPAGSSPSLSPSPSLRTPNSVAGMPPSPLPGLSSYGPQTKFNFEWREFPQPPISTTLRREPFVADCGPERSFDSPYVAFTAIWNADIMAHIARETNRKREARCSSSQDSDTDSVASLARGFELVNLLQHRHLLSENCVVCAVASKHGYEF